MDYIQEVVTTLIYNKAVKATKFINEKLIVRAVRKTFDKKIQPGNIEVILTIGKPNYVERDFIEKCKKAGEPFPVKKIQIKLPKNKR